MTRETNLAAIRAACIKANPEIEKAQEVPCFCHNDPKCIDAPKRPIRLADVLLAMNRANGEVVLKVIDGYNLTRDNIEDQSDEFLQFAADLLSTHPQSV